MMFNFRNTITTLFFIFISSFVTASEMTVENAWVREAPPVSRVQAAYATLKNNQPTEIKLVSANSPAFKKIEFHKTISENGLTKMQQQESIVIPAQSKAMLEPEGLHMMLFNPVTPLRAGEKINIHFKFSNGVTTSSSFVVKKTTGTDHHQHMHH